MKANVVKTIGQLHQALTSNHNLDATVGQMAEQFNTQRGCVRNLTRECCRAYVVNTLDRDFKNITR